MSNLKELIRDYIKEKQATGENISDNSTDLAKAKKHLFGIQDQRFLQSLLRIDNLESAQEMVLAFIDFLNEKAPSPDLTQQTALQAIQRFKTDVVRPEEEPEVEPEVEPVAEPEPEEEEEVEEISTSGGAGAYQTKYAFRLPKDHKKVK